MILILRLLIPLLLLLLALKMVISAIPR